MNEWINEGVSDILRSIIPALWKFWKIELLSRGQAKEEENIQEPQEATNNNSTH